MIAAKSPAGAKGTAETAELRNAEGKRGARNCGRTAERLRKDSHVSDLSPSPEPAPAPALVRPSVPDLPRKVASETPPTARGYGWPDNTPQSLARGLPAHEQAVIDAALAILAQHIREPGAVFDSPARVREYLRLHLARWEHERFGVLFLDSQHSLIAFEVLFEGTLAHTSVHPREVMKRALQLNAAAVILAHNHPSGTAEPSRADELLTTALQAALRHIDVRVLDHCVIGWPNVVSLAERGVLEPAVMPRPKASRPAMKRGVRAAVSAVAA